MKDGEGLSPPRKIFPVYGLEDELQRQLDIARLVDRVADLAEVISWASVVAWWGKADHIEGVQKVAPELDVTSFGDCEVLR